MLPEIEDNVSDKMMFFATQPFAGTFPPQAKLEAEIAKELPAFAWWLLNGYQAPPEVVTDDRMGVRSYFDPHILKLSHQQTAAGDLLELLQSWFEEDAYWQDEQTNADWIGNPTQLLTLLQRCPATERIASNWTQFRMAKNLTTLAKQGGSGVTFNGREGREFKIIKVEQEPTGSV